MPDSSTLELELADNAGLMILVAGPYRSGTGDDPEKMARNVRLMEAYTLPLFRAGHLPVVGEWRDAWSRDPHRELGTVWLQKQGEGEVLALTAECPHLGCKIGLHPEGESFACPCHESAFALDGSVQDGPSPRAMDRLEARVRDGLVEIRWKRFRTQLEDQVEIG